MKSIELESYTGAPLERGGTAMRTTTPAPALVWLVNSHYWNNPIQVLDYGAGHGRNAHYLRSLGLQVYAYDPFNGTHHDGWVGVSKKLPNMAFDVAITCFVLNVVTKSDEANILETVQSYSSNSFHITRNLDIMEMAMHALLKKDRLVFKFWQENFLALHELPEDTVPTRELIMDFCKHGFQTTKGFQRIPMLEADYGYLMIKRTGGYKIYQG